MRRTAGAFLASVMALVGMAAVSSPPSRVAAASVTDPVAIVIEGKGNGHGIGLSQWGAYGRAVNGGQGWEQILGAYYGGTNLGSVGAARVTTRLMTLDDQQTAVVSYANSAFWGASGPWGSIAAVPAGSGLYDVWALPAGQTVCPAPGVFDGWQMLADNVAGPVAFTTGVGEGAAPEALLGLCEPSGSVRHYRGSIVARVGTAGEYRTVNDADSESYLRGVVPREVAATWGSAGGGAGMHALRAQAVAARSYALRQARYSYAMTCDTQSCQVYGGAATRATTASTITTLEHALTDQAIVDTAGRVLRWNSDGTIVSAMFSASNGGASAGALFTPIDDPWDVIDVNPNARWTRVVSATELAGRFSMSGAVSSVALQPDPALTSQGYVGDWANRAVFTTRGGKTTVTAASLRSAYGLPSTAFTLRVVSRDFMSGDDLVMIGDSVGQGVANAGAGPLVTLLDGVYATAGFDNLVNRRLVCPSPGCVPADGVTVATALGGTPDIAIVELGYNDGASLTAGRVDQMMAALVGKGARTVGWVGLSERNTAYRPVNDVVRAARARWPQLQFLDWHAASAGGAKNRWFSDNVHLTSSGYAEFALWLRDRAIELGGGTPGTPRWSVKAGPSAVMRLPVAGVGQVPAGVSAVSLNVTVAEPDGWGYVTVWPCGAPRPEASNLNFVRGDTVPNAVIAPVDATGEICFFSYATTHLIVDLNGWFTAGLETTVPQRLLDTRIGLAAPTGKAQPAAPLRLKVAGTDLVPAGVSAVSLNVTAAEADAWGYVTVWPCDQPQPVASNLNYVRGDTVPNAVIAPVDANGEICLFTYAPTHLIVDINGWFTSGLSTVVPTRLVDTRSAIGAPLGRVQPQEPLRVTVAGTDLVPAGVSAVSLNVTVAEANAWGYVTVWPCAAARPEASNLNYVRGDTVPNAVIAPVDGNGEICLFTYDPVHLIVDINGWFTSGFAAVVPTRISDTRNGIGAVPGR